MNAAVLAGVGGELLSTWATTRGEKGRDPTQSAREMLALAQAAYSVTDDVNIAVTSIKAATATLLDARKLEEIGKLGIRDAATRPVAEVLREIVEKTAHAPELLTPIFDQSARDLAKVFMDRSARDTYRKVMAGTSDLAAATDQFNRDVNRLADTTRAHVEAASDKISSAFGRFSDAIGLRTVSATVLTHLPELATLAGAGWLGWKGIRGVGRLWNRRRRGGGAPGLSGGPGGLLEAAAGPGLGVVRRMTVGTLVVRGGVVGGGGMLGGGGRGKRGRGGGGMLGGGGRGWRGLGGRVAGRLPWAGALVSGGVILGELRDGDMAGALREGGAAFGMTAGGMLGATLGPVGAVIGGVLGHAAGDAIMDFLVDGLPEREDTPSERRRRRGRQGKRRADAGREEVDAMADADAESAEPDRPRRSVRWRTRSKRRADAGREEVDATADAEPDKPRRTGRAGVRTRELAIAPPATAVTNNIDRRTSITMNVQVPPGANAEETGRIVAEEVDRVLRERDARCQDEIDSIVTDRNFRIPKY